LKIFNFKQNFRQKFLIFKFCLTRMARPFIRHPYVIVCRISIGYIDFQIFLDNLIQFAAYSVFARNFKIIDMTFQDDSLISSEMWSNSPPTKHQVRCGININFHVCDIGFFSTGFINELIVTREKDFILNKICRSFI